VYLTSFSSDGFSLSSTKRTSSCDESPFLVPPFAEILSRLPQKVHFRMTNISSSCVCALFCGVLDSCPPPQPKRDPHSSIFYLMLSTRFLVASSLTCPNFLTPESLSSVFFPSVGPQSKPERCEVFLRQAGRLFWLLLIFFLFV